MVKIQLNQLEVECVVNTGAEGTMMSPETSQRLGLKKKSAGKATLVGFTGETALRGIPRYPVTIQLGTKTIEWQVYVAPITDPFLLGLDLMLATSVTILGGGPVLVNGEPVDTSVEKTAGAYNTSRVLFKRPSTLPASSKQGVWGVVEDPLPGMSTSLEPTGVGDDVSAGGIIVPMEEQIPGRTSKVRLKNRCPDTLDLLPATYHHVRTLPQHFLDKIQNSADAQDCAGDSDETGENPTSADAQDCAGDPDETGENPTSANAEDRAGDPDETGEDCTSADAKDCVGDPDDTGEDTRNQEEKSEPESKEEDHLRDTEESELGLRELFGSQSSAEGEPCSTPNQECPRQRGQRADPRRRPGDGDQASDSGSEGACGESESPGRVTQRGRVVNRPSRLDL